MIDLKNLTIRKAHQSLLNGEYTAVELATAYLEKIKEKDSKIHAYLEVFTDVISQAQEADRRIAKKENVTLLTGIPLAVKDNILIKNRVVSAASKMLENYRAVYDATVIKKLKEAGVVFLGRTNMDEFAMGGSTENSAFGPTYNPHDLERVPGGSSGGSAAAVAAEMALVALGSDTGGSIRQPASFCGLVGLKPTYGAVSRYGLMAMASSFDVIGPLARTADDAQILFDFIRGRDDLDSTTLKDNLYQIKDEGSIRGMKIGIPQEVTESKGLDQTVLENFKKAVKKLKELGCEVKTISLPNLAYSLATYYTLVPAEVSSNMARYDGIRYGLTGQGKDIVDDYFKNKQAGFGPEVKRRIILGTYVLSAGYYDAYYNKANIVRDLIKKDYAEAFKEVDIILTPSTPGPAFKVGEKINDPLQLYLEDIFTVPANLAGIPAMSLPFGFKEVNNKKLPLGLQLFADAGNEAQLFVLAKNFEEKE